MGGYVYVMRKGRFPKRYKIGKSVKVERRLKTIDRAVPGKVRLVCSYWFWNYSRVEKILHKKFAEKRDPLRRAKKGAGRTEWFNLSFFEYWQLRWTLRVLYYWPFGLIFLIIFLYTAYRGS